MRIFSWLPAAAQAAVLAMFATAAPTSAAEASPAPRLVSLLAADGMPVPAGLQLAAAQRQAEWAALRTDLQLTPAQRDELRGVCAAQQPAIAAAVAAVRTGVRTLLDATLAPAPKATADPQAAARALGAALADAGVTAQQVRLAALPILTPAQRQVLDQHGAARRAAQDAAWRDPAAAAGRLATWRQAHATEPSVVARLGLSGEQVLNLAGLVAQHRGELQPAALAAFAAWRDYVDAIRADSPNEAGIRQAAAHVGARLGVVATQAAPVLAALRAVLTPAQQEQVAAWRTATRARVDQVLAAALTQLAHGAAAPAGE